MVADLHSCRIFRFAIRRIQRAPIAADRALPFPLPRLVIGLEQIDAILASLGALENLGNEAGLIDARSQRNIAHPSVARPARLPDEDFLARKGRHYLRADLVDMRGCILGAAERSCA